MFIDRLNNDYYPYGMLVPNRNFSSPEYRYGFQGQEKDDEVKGNGNSLNYKFRIHDPRVGRFLSLDPLSAQYPFYSPYAFSGNRVIDMIELEGLEPKVENGELVGYTMQANQGPTQISLDINNPTTQKKYGYTLQSIINWVYVISENEEYYKERGDWNGSSLYDKKNPVWNNLNSNKGEKLTIRDEFVMPSVMKPITTQNQTPEKEDAGNWFSTETGLAGSALGIGEKMLYSKNYGRWLGKNGKYYPMTTPGNQYTGGKNKWAKTNSKWLGRGGFLLSGYSVYATNKEYEAGLKSTGQYYTDQSFNVVGFLGAPGAAANLGYNLGYIIEDICNCNIQLNFEAIEKNRMDALFSDPKEPLPFKSILSDDFLNNKKDENNGG